MSEVLSKGFRFHPADEELVRHYLMRKTSSPDFRCFIKTMEVFDSEPWTLPHVRDACYGEQEWYYFVEKNPSGHKSLSEEDFEKPRYSGIEHPILEWTLVKELVTSQTIPPSLHTYGFRFHPTDKELVTLYLAPKNASSDFECFIQELEMFAKEPW
ncbi:unnamed protein product, partial [Brassica rapa subsp. trilocularis]